MTQLNILKAAFDRNEVLTVAEALTRYGLYALSQRAGELRRLGYPLDDDMITLPNGKHIKQYYKLNVAYG